MKAFKSIFSVATIFLILNMGSAHAITSIWINDGNGEWGNPINWDNGIPNGTVENWHYFKK